MRQWGDRNWYLNDTVGPSTSQRSIWNFQICETINAFTIIKPIWVVVFIVFTATCAGTKYNDGPMKDAFLHPYFSYIFCCCSASILVEYPRATWTHYVLSYLCNLTHDLHSPWKAFISLLNLLQILKDSSDMSLSLWIFLARLGILFFLATLHFNEISIIKFSIYKYIFFYLPYYFLMALRARTISYSIS